VQLESRSNAVNNPADNRLEVAEEITKQLTGNAIRESTEGGASNSKMDVWRNEGARVTSSATQHEADQLDTTSRPRQQPKQGQKTRADAAKQGDKVRHSLFSSWFESGCANSTVQSAGLGSKA
jgi:hypothetical protein